MKLWSGLLSPFSAKVRIVLAEKDLPVEIMPIPWSRQTLWGPKPSEFVAVSPRGQVPVLIDGDVVVYDSTVICEYLEDRYPSPPIFPADPAGRARCRQLEDEADQSMMQEVTPLVRELFTKTDEATRDLASVAAGSEALARRFERLDGELAGREYLCGRFSVADVATFMVVGFASTFGVLPADGRRNLRGWADRVRTRPTVAHEFDAMMRAAAMV
jgi:glutathione S-transferase